MTVAWKARAATWPGLKCYTTNTENPTTECTTGAYHRLWRTEKSVRMSKHDLEARLV